MTDSDIIWGAPAIGRAIGKSTKATYHLLEQGRLPANKLGKKWVASRARLTAAILDDPLAAHVADVSRRGAGK